MRSFYIVLSCVSISAVFYLVFVNSVYRDISEEREGFVVIKNNIRKINGSYKEKDGDHNIVEKVSQMAGSMRIDAETLISNNKIHIKAVGDYQQLIRLLIGLVEESQSLFILSLSLFSTDAQENNGHLEMDAVFEMY